MKKLFGAFLLFGLIAGPTATLAAAPATGQIGLLDSDGFAEARRVADWIVATKNSTSLPFMVIDKVNARLFLFDGSGTVRATTSVLLGMARGDDSPPGIGSRKLSAITPAERITPAGRFVTHVGQNLDGSGVLWIDYDAAIALHRAPSAGGSIDGLSRSARLASASPANRRISFGCINVSPAFYDAFIQPIFGATTGIAYILPETRSATSQFGMQKTGGAG